MTGWPGTAEALEVLEATILRSSPEPWLLPASLSAVGACAVVFGRGGAVRGAAGEPAFAAAALWRDGRPLAWAALSAPAPAAFEFGRLALREGPLLEAAVRRLPERPEVLLVHGGGRDHPRGCGLAVVVGALLDLPTAGVTGEPLRASGASPAGPAGSLSPLFLGGNLVGVWVRTRRGARPVVAHAGWRVAPESAAALVLACARGRRLPEPLRLALEAARLERARAARRER
ncbi:MAG TPA: endonuclease V [Anaeromyxobacteraceae bacterium]|nr:endonuclease V [Anaeromyxobacteraceae bacterium]